MTQEEINLKEVRENGYIIKFIKEPSEAVKLAAVQQNGYAIRFIEDPSVELQLLAVTQNVECVKYLKSSTIVNILGTKGLKYKEIFNFFVLIENEDYSLVQLLF